VESRTLGFGASRLLAGGGRWWSNNRSSDRGCICGEPRRGSMIGINQLRSHRTQTPRRSTKSLDDSIGSCQCRLQTFFRLDLGGGGSGSSNFLGVLGFILLMRQIQGGPTCIGNLVSLTVRLGCFLSASWLVTPNSNAGLIRTVGGHSCYVAEASKPACGRVD